MADKKPNGYIEKFLVIDAETSGMCFGTDDPSYDPVTKDTYQAVSWGLIVASANTLKPIEELYVEVQWDGKSKWDKRAEAVHGLSLDYLENHGQSSEDAACSIAELILKHWGPDSPIHLAGHNVMTFDAWFLRRQMRDHGINLRIGNKSIDTNAIGFATFHTHNSDDLFQAVGLPTRNANKHNALDDARNALHVIRIVRTVFQQFLDGK
jgi:DNA polymerase III epsilon subunit-like protein